MDDVIRPAICNTDSVSMTAIYVAKQLGHSLAVLLSTYAHLIAEYEDAERIDAEAEIRKARGKVGSDLVRTTAI